MTVGKRVYSGKGAREEGAAALTLAILSWRDDLTLQVRGTFRGFEILSRGRGATLLIGSDEERLPELFIRGCGHLQGAAERGEPGRDDAEHRTCAAQPRQGRGGRAGARRPRGKDAGGF